MLASVGVGVDAETPGKGVEGALHGVSVDTPLPRHLHGVAGGAPHPREREGGARRLRRLRHPRRRRLRRGRRPREVSSRLVPRPGDLHAPGRCPCLDDLHPVLGQGSRLVGADERGRPEGLDGLEVAHQDLPLGHLLGPPGQRQRDGGQQRLRHEGDGHPDGEDEAVLQRVADEQRDEEEQASNAHGDRRNEAHHGLEAARQRCDRLRRGGRQPGDAGEAGALPGGDHDGPRLALDDERPGIQGLACAHRARGALPRQHRGVHQQPVGHGHRGVGGDPVATLEQEQVADHDVLGLDDLPPAVATHRHPGRQHGAQPVGSPVRPGLLGERERGVEHDHREDGDPELRQPGHQREDPSGPEHDREEVRQLAEEAAHDRGPARLGKPVRPVGITAGSSHVRAEAGCGGDGHAVPFHSRDQHPATDSRRRGA